MLLMGVGARVKSVQSGTVLLFDTTAQVTIRIAPVDLSRSFAIGTPMTGTTSGAARHSLRYTLTAPDTLLITRYEAHIGSVSIRWQVVELEGDATVQHIVGKPMIESGGRGYFTISPVDPTRTFILQSAEVSLATSYGPYYAFPRLSITAPTRLTVEDSAGLDSTIHSIFVVEVK